ncbi:MAG: flagellar biosynthesis protein FlhB [Deltaproteobacteria bacterium]|nr:flagellar biosynthesis protein FlhB [Deltaproteobacteria bacterium]
MADEEKTEEPTGRRLEDARKKGQVAYTKELGSTLGLVGVLSIVVLGGGWLYSAMERFFKMIFNNLEAWPYNQPPLWDVIVPGLEGIFRVMIAVFGVAFLFPLIGHFAQKGLIMNVEGLTPNIEKLSPVEGAKKLFSKETLVQFAKSFVKACGLLLVYYFVVKPRLREITYSASKPYENALGLYYDVVIGYLLMAVIFMILVIAIDYVIQRVLTRKKLMMSKQEIKDEHKEMEGNPEVKRKVREFQREQAMRTIQAEVPQATVVVTNPTHFAVALRYEKGKVPVPRVVAKGADILCQRVKDVAREHGVPIVENPPLARGIYRDVKVGHDIPRKYYKAVAKIIATIFQLEEEKKRQRQALLGNNLPSGGPSLNR